MQCHNANATQAADRLPHVASHFCAVQRSCSALGSLPEVGLCSTFCNDFRPFYSHCTAYHPSLQLARQSHKKAHTQFIFFVTKSGVTCCKLQKSLLRVTPQTKMLCNPFIFSERSFLYIIFMILGFSLDLSISALSNLWFFL